MSNDRKSLTGPGYELFGILAKTGLGLLPGGRAAVGIYELLNFSGKQLAEFMERRAEERCREFHRRLCNGGQINEDIAKNLDAADYQALLAACLSELEDEKAGLYGTLASSIGLGTVDARYKRFMILALKNLSFAQLTLARHAFIATHNALKPFQGGGNLEPGNCLKIGSGDDLDELNYESLIQARVVKERSLTSIGKKLISSCYDTNDLTPESIGSPVWWNAHLDILSFELGGAVTSLSTHFSSMAWNLHLRSSIRRPNGEKTLSPTPKIYVLITDSGADHLAEFQQTLLAEIGKQHMFIVHLRQLTPEQSALFPDAVWIDGQNKSKEEIADELKVLLTR